MLDEYRTRRDNLYGWLTADPRIKCQKPAGAFYMFPDISEAMAACGFKTSIEFAQALLDESRVAVTPGEAFDSPGFVRMSYATSMDNLQRRQPASRRVRAGARRCSGRGRAVSVNLALPHIFMPNNSRRHGPHKPAQNAPARIRLRPRHPRPRTRRLLSRINRNPPSSRRHRPRCRRRPHNRRRRRRRPSSRRSRNGSTSPI